MTDEASDVTAAHSAGAMLRAARERQGLHIAALAAAIKVPQAKLEALEAGRYDELTDATFVRALAQSVCRVLKIDAKPVLDLMPTARTTMLDRVQPARRTPFHDKPGREEPSEPRLWHQPVFWIVAVLLVAAAGFVLWPQRPEAWSSWLAKLPGFGFGSGESAEPAAVTEANPASPAVPAAVPAATASAPEAVATPVPASVLPAAASPSTPVASEAVHSAPAATLAAPAEAPAGVVVVRASEPSWVEANDARGNVLLSRTLQPGEAVGLDGALPLKLVIGNASATEVTLRGKRITLGQPNRDNVVKLELK